MKNQELAEIFYEMADLLEMSKVEWKPRAYRQAARAIDSLPEDIKNIYKKGGLKILEEIPGVGEGIGKKIIEFLETGKIKEHRKLIKKIPSHIDILLKIPGMGPKKAEKLNTSLHITTISQLKKAAKEHKIASLPGFGDTSEKAVLEGIEMMRTSAEKISYKKAKSIAEKIISSLKDLPEIKKISVAGSLRRKKSLIKDIDILISSKNPEKVISVFTSLRYVKKILAKGKTKSSIILKEGIQVDLRVLDPYSWGAGLLYFTGSKNYNIEMRKIAIKKGFKLNEYGLFDKKTGKNIAGRTEQEICKILGVRYIRPEERNI